MVLSIDLEFSDKESINFRKRHGRVRNWTAKIYQHAGGPFSDPIPLISFPVYLIGFVPDFDHFYEIFREFYENPVKWQNPVIGANYIGDF